MKCCGFDLDKNLGTYEDKPCCQICKWYDPIGDECLIEMEYSND